MDLETLFRADTVTWNWPKPVKMWDMLGHVLKAYEPSPKLKKKVAFKSPEIKRRMTF